MSFNDLISKYKNITDEKLLQELKLSDTVEKRIFFNSIYNKYSGIVAKNFLPNINHPYLLKGSSAWSLNYPEKRSFSFLPQNFDIEIYVKQDENIQNNIKDIYRSLLKFYKNNDLNSFAKKENLSLCLSTSSNILIGKTKTEQKDNSMCIEQRNEDNPAYFQVTTPQMMENLKAWSMSLCFKFNDKKIRDKYRDYYDTGCIGKTDDYHFMIYLTIIPYTTEDFKDYFNEITDIKKIDNQGVRSLNKKGLLLYHCFIKSKINMRSEKKIDIDTIRINNTLHNNSSSEIENAYIDLFDLVDILESNQSLIPNKFYIDNLRNYIISQVLNYHRTITDFKDGIKTYIDNIVINFFRPIVNLFVVDLQKELKQYDDVYTFIAGGDAFERYIPSGKIADIDIKILLKYMNALKNKEYKDILKNNIDKIKKIIFYVLTKHSTILNEILDRKDCYLERALFTKFVEKCTITNTDVMVTQERDGILLCPLEKKYTKHFRVRNIDLVNIKNKITGFNLTSLDYNKNFNVVIKRKNKIYNLKYKYSLAIFDAPLVFDTKFDPEYIVNLPLKIVDDPFRECYKSAVGECILQNKVYLPVASPKFLIKDIEERFNDKNLLLLRYQAGKIQKDVERLNQLIKYKSDKIDSTYDTMSGLYYCLNSNVILTEMIIVNTLKGVYEMNMDKNKYKENYDYPDEIVLNLKQDLKDKLTLIMKNKNISEFYNLLIDKNYIKENIIIESEAERLAREKYEQKLEYEKLIKMKLEKEWLQKRMEKAYGKVKTTKKDYKYQPY